MDKQNATTRLVRRIDPSRIPGFKLPELIPDETFETGDDIHDDGSVLAVAEQAGGELEEGELAVLPDIGYDFVYAGGGKVELRLGEKPREYLMENKGALFPCFIMAIEPAPSKQDTTETEKTIAIHFSQIHLPNETLKAKMTLENLRGLLNLTENFGGLKGDDDPRVRVEGKNPDTKLGMSDVFNAGLVEKMMAADNGDYVDFREIATFNDHYVNTIGKSDLAAVRKKEQYYGEFKIRLIRMLDRLQDYDDARRVIGYIDDPILQGQLQAELNDWAKAEAGRNDTVRMKFKQTQGRGIGRGAKRIAFPQEPSAPLLPIQPAPKVPETIAAAVGGPQPIEDTRLVDTPDRVRVAKPNNETILAVAPEDKSDTTTLNAADSAQTTSAVSGLASPIDTSEKRSLLTKVLDWFMGGDIDSAKANKLDGEVQRIRNVA